MPEMVAGKSLEEWDARLYGQCGKSQPRLDRLRDFVRAVREEERDAIVETLRIYNAVRKSDA